MNPHPEPRRLAEFADLDGPARLEILAHVRECAGCRERWLADDPSRLFSALRQASPPQEVLERLSAGLDAAIDRAEARGGRRRGYAFAAVAASLLLAGTFAVFLFRNRTDVAPLPGPDGLAVVETVSEPVPRIELLSSPGEARVVDLTVGETQVLMIFDEALDL